MKPEKTLITTHTGEPSQPVRIYYQVVKPKTVERVFNKLRCNKAVKNLSSVGVGFTNTKPSN